MEFFGDMIARFWAWTTHDPVAFYTFVLAIFTFVLGLVAIFQAAMLIRADKTARLAAEAAMLSSRAAIAIKLPIIRIAPDSLGHGDNRLGETVTEDCYVHSVTISNLGAMKAFPFEIIYGWTVGRCSA